MAMDGKSKCIFGGSMLLAAVIAGSMAYQETHSIPATLFFGILGAAGIYFSVLRAIG